MTRLARTIALLAPILLLSAVAVQAENGGVAESGPFRVEWRSHPAGVGREIVSGYVENQREMRTENVRVRVEPLGPARAGDARIAYLPGTIAPGGRGYFEVRLPTASGRYRVVVEWFDWAGCGNG